MATKLKRNYSDDQLREAVATAITIAGVIRTLGLKSNAGTYQALNRYIKNLGIDTSHFLGLAHKKGCTGRNLIPLDEILVKDTPYKGHGSYLKIRLIKAGILEDKCVACNIGPTWNNIRLTLQLDHINGQNTDNRLENLRILCPNCHTQTSTYGGRNIAGAKASKFCECGRQIASKGDANRSCRFCAAKARRKQTIH